MSFNSIILTSSYIEKTISTISREESKWDLPHTFEEVMEIANDHFKNYHYKNDILLKVEACLNSYKVSGQIDISAGDSVNISDQSLMIKSVVGNFFIYTELFKKIPIIYL